MFSHAWLPINLKARYRPADVALSLSGKNLWRCIFQSGVVKHPSLGSTSSTTLMPPIRPSVISPSDKIADDLKVCDWTSPLPTVNYSNLRWLKMSTNGPFQDHQPLDSTAVLQSLECLPCCCREYGVKIKWNKINYSPLQDSNLDDGTLIC